MENTVKRANEVLMNLNVQVGNFTDSRLGSHSYTLWTETCDYLVKTEDGKELAYQKYSYKFTTYEKISVPEKLIGATEIKFEDLPATVRKMTVRELFPDLSENEQILLAHGEEKGQEIIELNEWVATHLIYGDEKLTRRILRDYGKRWEKIEDISSNEFVLDDTTLVTTYREDYDREYHEYYIPYDFRNWERVQAERKEYQDKVYSLAKSFKVPCRIVRAVLNSVSKEKVSDALNKIAETKKSVISDADKWELSCGKDRRRAVLLKLTGIDFSSKYYNEDVAIYLLH